MKNKKEGHCSHFIFSLYLNSKMKSFCQMFFQDGSIFIRKADLPEESEPELFLKEPKLCQPNPTTLVLVKELILQCGDPHGMGRGAQHHNSLQQVLDSVTEPWKKESSYSPSWPE